MGSRSPQPRTTREQRPAAAEQGATMEAPLSQQPGPSAPAGAPRSAPDWAPPESAAPMLPAEVRIAPSRQSSSGLLGARITEPVPVAIAERTAEALIAHRDRWVRHSAALEAGLDAEESVEAAEAFDSVGLAEELAEVFLREVVGAATGEVSANLDAYCEALAEAEFLPPGPERA